MPPTSIILTGGPSTGKTTVLEKLSEYGFQTIPEEARRIIKKQIEQNGDGLPWKNKERYSRLMIEASIATYNKVLSGNSEGFVFFDRGIPDANRIYGNGEHSYCCRCVFSG